MADFDGENNQTLLAEKLEVRRAIPTLLLLRAKCIPLDSVGRMADQKLRNPIL